ncbi:hypothetical protein APHAL10511_002404 [Amanita phalloides]|nr:hypothetical protein APHAL10511_002404 [Amanita phalloides]
MRSNSNAVLARDLIDFRYLHTTPPDDHPLTTVNIPSVPLMINNIPRIGRLSDGIFNMNTSQLPFDSEKYAEPYTICLLYPDARDAISALPGFSGVYHSSLRLQYRICDTPKAGKGMFALTDMDVGDLILRERPMFLVPQLVVSARIVPAEEMIENSLLEMTRQDREDFHNLANCKPNETLTMGIIHTNILDALCLPGSYNGAYGGICRDLSRVNHRSVIPTLSTVPLNMRNSCVPNAAYRWILKDLVYELRALRPIKKGEQIFISYIPLLQARASRRQDLYSKYSFTCNCPACVLPSPCSDVRRNSLRIAAERDHAHDDSTLKAWIEDLSLPDDYVIAKSIKFVDIMNAEDLVEQDIWKLHYPRLTKAYCAIKDTNNAKLWARQTAKLLLAVNGDDCGWNKVADSPESTDWWGRRKRM